jgi:hypothetical protein
MAQGKRHHWLVLTLGMILCAERDRTGMLTNRIRQAVGRRNREVGKGDPSGPHQG